MGSATASCYRAGGLSTRCVRPPLALRLSRVTRRPSLRSESSCGPCGPVWTETSRPSTTSRQTRIQQSVAGLAFLASPIIGHTRDRESRGSWAPDRATARSVAPKSCYPEAAHCLASHRSSSVLERYDPTSVDLEFAATSGRTDLLVRLQPDGGRSRTTIWPPCAPHAPRPDALTNRMQPTRERSWTRAAQSAR